MPEKPEQTPPDIPAELQHQLQARRLTEKQAQELEVRYGKVFRFVRRYMQEQGVRMEHQVEGVFTATRCVQCKRAVVFFDTSRFIPQASQFHRLLRLSPNQGTGPRHRYINTCPYCGRWHGKRMIETIHDQNREKEEQTCVIFSGMQYLLWLQSQPQEE
ncbi:hypothetical protein [Deinococcus cellulosilyticus]|uniref:Uncharacterized protein n=1 Tax=Deinococcus cellulosilyticus (strain DSM 18568 / NBRC 106333 / KACC 11606 / 5516J-15) TaxID=1223518 RepID=A0A511N9X3_DEIC1|nr:hypothetical protein [Deinococcus cellulosilyticus]GEM49298.1 hypothetical protein DC3_49330 [Deinococcus cellulosilyticus NBRC 106333 = KACC 11606]